MIDYIEYEEKKAAWIKANPDATQEQYEAAIAAILREFDL